MRNAKLGNHLKLEFKRVFSLNEKELIKNDSQRRIRCIDKSSKTYTLQGTCSLDDADFYIMSFMIF